MPVRFYEGTERLLDNDLHEVVEKKVIKIERWQEGDRLNFTGGRAFEADFEAHPDEYKAFLESIKPAETVVPAAKPKEKKK